MNWVGGIRDKVHRKNNWLKKQQEYFERKRIKHYKDNKFGSSKKGSSQDIVNLHCISKTIRNPFDQEEHKDKSSNFMNDKSFKVESNQRILKKTTHPSSRRTFRDPHCRRKIPPKSREKFLTKTRSKNLRENIIQSTPLLPESNFVSFNAIENTLLPDPVSHSQLSMPSPISTQRSSNSSIHPLTFLTDDDETNLPNDSLFRNNWDSGLMHSNHLYQKNFLSDIPQESCSQHFAPVSYSYQSHDCFTGHDWLPYKSTEDEVFSSAVKSSCLKDSYSEGPHTSEGATESDDLVARPFLYDDHSEEILDENIYPFNFPHSLGSDPGYNQFVSKNPKSMLIRQSHPSSQTPEPLPHFLKVSLEDSCSAPSCSTSHVKVDSEVKVDSKDACTSPIKWPTNDVSTQVANELI